MTKFKVGDRVRCVRVSKYDYNIPITVDTRNSVVPII